MDIIILLICTFLIINKLIKMLGQFNPDSDKERVRKAYIMTIKAISESDFKTLEFLMEGDIYKKIQQDIENSKLNGLINKNSVKDINQINLIGAALYGDRAVLTVEVNSQHIAFTEDSNGNLISGSSENIVEQTHKIVFCRYLTQSTVWKISKIS